MTTRSILPGLTMGLALLALPSAAFATDGFARSTSTLRAGAGSNYPAVMRVAAGTELDVIGCLRRYSWCDVSVGGERGWFPGSRIGFLRDGRRLSPSDGGAALGLAILSFGMADYWGNHYSNRPFYNERRWWRGHGAMPGRDGGPLGEIGRSPRDPGRSPIDQARPTPRVEPPVVQDRAPVVQIPRALREPTRIEQRRETDRTAPRQRTPAADGSPHQPPMSGPGNQPGGSEPLLIPGHPGR